MHVQSPFNSSNLLVHSEGGRVDCLSLIDPIFCSAPGSIPAAACHGRQIDGQQQPGLAVFGTKGKERKSISIPDLSCCGDNCTRHVDVARVRDARARTYRPGLALQGVSRTVQDCAVL